MKKFIIIILLSILSLNLFSQDSLREVNLSEVQVVGIKPTKLEPITISTLIIDSITNFYKGDDPFFIINRYTPNVFSQSDNGSNYGYSYIRLRGLDQTRINFTLNGIPLNEMEDQGIYFSNMPDFLSNIGKIEIQRGIGSSKYGNTSFAGSVNMTSKSILNKEISGEIGVGSFNTLRQNIRYSSGLLKNKFAFSSSLSYLKSDGFRDNSSTEGFTYFGEFGYFDKKNIVKLWGFSGRSKNDMAWLATTKEQINEDYKYNLNSEEEVDQFNQNLVSLNWINFKHKNITTNSSLYFNNINGFYTSFLDSSQLGLFSLNSYQGGAMSNVVYEKNNFNLNSGINFNIYARSHTLADNLYPSVHFYKNWGYKKDFITYFKLNRNFNGLNLFLDLQYRWVNFNYNNELSYNWNFINPKFGAKYESKSWSTYISLASTGREVTRTDLLRGYDNIDEIKNNRLIAFSDTFQVNSKPERCYNIEIGGSFHTKTFKISANFFGMSFIDERIPTGIINYIGLTIKNPVEESSRIGLEIESQVSFKGFTIGNNLSVMRSRIKFWTNGVDTYQNVESANTPRFLMTNYLQYKWKKTFINLNGYFVSSMFLDNTQNNLLTTPNYYILNTSLGTEYKIFALSININNITNQKFYLPGGVSPDNQPTYYVGALSNIFVKIRVSL
jgi:iron complex outermembrane receptor protein